MPPLVQDFLGWYIILMLSLGSETKALIDNRGLQLGLSQCPKGSASNINFIETGDNSSN